MECQREAHLNGCMMKVENRPFTVYGIDPGNEYLATTTVAGEWTRHVFLT